MTGRRGRRELQPDERVLWETVARTARPLRGAPPAPSAQDEPPPEDAAEPPRGVQRAERGPPGRGLEPFDRRLRTRLVRGSARLDGRIDLHGLTQHEAHARLRAFLAEAQQRSARIVLVITGKGRPEGASPIHAEERGILRRVVPLWLASPEFRPFVSGFEEAHRTHGGGGALYVRVRRVRGEQQ